MSDQFVLRVRDSKGTIRNSFPCSLEYAQELKDRRIEELKIMGYEYDLSSDRWVNPKSPVEYQVHVVRLANK